MPPAMNLTYGDYIVIELALLQYIQKLDLSLQSGQYLSELIGKLEYQLTSLRSSAGVQLSSEIPVAP